MLKLRRGTVVSADPLEVEVAGERRRAWADPAAVGRCEVGDEVVVNTAALDLGLGSGGFDLVHVNLTRGLDGGETPPGVHVMKLNYSSIQHPVAPIEEGAGGSPGRTLPVAVVPLHGHLAPLAFAFREAGGGRLGYVQTAGGALPGTLSRDVSSLLEGGLLAGHVTAAPCYGGRHESISVAGAIDAAGRELGWDAVVAGPGPGILGSASRLGHGGLAALDNAHAALALGCPVLVAPRLSESDPRERHRGLSHHTRTVLELLLAGVSVAMPESARGGEVESELLAACGETHRLLPSPAGLEDYASSGLPTRTMGRGIDEDALFFAAPLASGVALTEIAAAAS